MNTGRPFASGGVATVREMANAVASQDQEWRVGSRSGDDPLPVWERVMARAGPLRAVLEECRLGLTGPMAASRLGVAACQLHHYLRCGRVPPFRLLRDWAYVVILVGRAEVPSWSLHVHAIRAGSEPGVYYRFFRRTTGRTWCELRAEGRIAVMRRAVGAWAPYLAPAPGSGRRGGGARGGNRG